MEIGTGLEIFSNKNKDKYIDVVVGPQSYHRLNEIISKIDKDSKKIN